MSYLIVDIGGTNTRLALYSELDKDSLVQVTRFTTEQRFIDHLEKLIVAINELLDKSEVERRLQHIVISHAGVVDRRKNEVINAGNLPDFENQPLADKLMQAFDCVVDVENDVVLAALGQYHFGMHNMDVANFSYATVSTGFSATNIREVGGKLIVQPIELGHNMFSGENKICNCGQIDCFEVYVGGKSISTRFVKEAQNIDDLRIWEDSVDYLAIAFANHIRYFHPQLLTIGGGVVNGNSYVHDKIQLEISKQIRLDLMPRLKVSEFGDDVGLLGGLAYIALRDKLIIAGDRVLEKQVKHEEKQSKLHLRQAEKL